MLFLKNVLFLCCKNYGNYERGGPSLLSQGCNITLTNLSS
jgi:hypothetical protein